MALISCVAGPSRSVLTVRALHTSASRLSAAPPTKPHPHLRKKVLLQPPPRTRQRQLTAVPAAPAKSAASSTPPSSVSLAAPEPQALDPVADYKDWPWHPLNSTSGENGQSGKDSGPSAEVFERTIFARPDDITHGRPQRIAWVWIFILTASTAVLAAPSPSDIEQLAEQRQQAIVSAAAESAANGEGIASSTNLPPQQDRLPTDGLMFKILASFGIIQTGIVGAMLLGGVWVTKLHSSSITRLSQIRITPRSVASVRETPQHKIRVITALNQSKIPFYPKFRDYDLDQVKVRLINPNATDYLNLDAGKSLGYRMSFFKLSKSLQESDAEVVLSISRIERVFGKLEMPKPVVYRRFWSPLSDRLDKWADARK